MTVDIYVNKGPLPGIVACAVHNPTNRRVDFEDGWLVKSSFITKDKHMKLVTEQGPNSNNNNKNKKIYK
jgi:hypothetical protein